MSAAGLLESLHWAEHVGTIARGGKSTDACAANLWMPRSEPVMRSRFWHLVFEGIQFGPARLAAEDRRDDETGLHCGHGGVDRARVAYCGAAAIGRGLAGDRREFDHPRDARCLRAIMHGRGRSGLIAQDAPFGRA